MALRPPKTASCSSGQRKRIGWWCPRTRISALFWLCGMRDGQERESLDRLLREAQGVVEAVHVAQLPDGGGPGLPEVGPGVQAALQGGEEFIGREGVKGGVAIGEDAFAAEH